MRSLTIDLPVPDSVATEEMTQRIAVSHLMAREAEIGEVEIPLGVSPGVLLVLPLRVQIQINIDSDTILVPPGTGIVIDGAARKTLAVVKGADNDLDLSGQALRLVELNALINDAFPLREQFDLPFFLSYKRAETINGLFDQLSFGGRTLMMSPRLFDMSQHLAAAYLVSILLRTAERTMGERRVGKSDERVALLKQFLLNNMTSVVTNPDMATHLGMSRSAFCRWAKLHLGKAPARYLRELRLERSLECLAQDTAGIEQVAAQTGFSDRYHLGKEFKKLFGLTPAEYRRLCHATPHDYSLVSLVERLFSHNRFEEALAACEQGLQAGPSPLIRDRLRYQRGLCLRAMGRAGEAVAEWEALEGGAVGFIAGMQRCRHLFDSGKIDEALAVLAKLYEQADEFQRPDVVHLWMDQVFVLAEARQPHPLRRYLAVRGELFPHNMQSVHLAAHTLRLIGEDEEATRQCADENHLAFFALRRAGRLNDAIDRYGAHTSASNIADSLAMYGWWDEILAMNDPDLRRQNAHALTALGRSEDAITRFPQDSACAYVALRRFRDLLERFPEDTSENIERLYALHALGMEQELRKFSTRHEWQRVVAQLYVCPEAVLDAKTAEAYRHFPEALLLIAIRALGEGNREEAEAVLGRIDGVRSPDLWWSDHNSTELLLVSVLHALLGAPEHLSKDLAEIIKRHKFKNRQELWHDASYLSGGIKQDAYLKQPGRAGLADRLTFITAIADDLKGRHTAARHVYSRFIAKTQPYGYENLLRHRFAEWRLQS